MQYGICPLSIISVRESADSSSEVITQLLYGEHFKVLEHRKQFSNIRNAFDASEGWIANNQFVFIEEDVYLNIEAAPKSYTTDLVSYVTTEKEVLLSIVLGSSIGNISVLNHSFEGNKIMDTASKSALIATALFYLESPFLSGGISPFGIDSAGFTQMVYRINGHRLLRTPKAQASQGNALSFIEESEPGDLAFFDNSDGEINHVGIIMEDNYLIHVNGKVRIDRIDHTGIFNMDKSNYTHKLRVIKKII